jgi:hypothetical protein
MWFKERIMGKNLLIICLVFLSNNIYGQEVFNLQWRDTDAEIEEAHIGDKIIIKFESRNISDNEFIEIEIWEKTNGKLMDFIQKLQGTVNNGFFEIERIIEFDVNNENTNYGNEIKENGYAIIDYVFIVKYNEINISSPSLAILSWINNLFINGRTGEPMRNRDFVFISPDGEFFVGKTDDEGYGKIRNLRKIGRYTYII